MDSAKNELVDKLKGANNILVSVSRNPSVDQLSALLGLALALNKMGKHAAAVFSGEIPSTLEFLQPEDTFKKNTDSLRDFIIALDKAKADKLRYKVEDNVVRIFITPYKTAITDDDLEFSQGDFNVDVVVAIGVKQQEDLDEAITAHGRILHDATVTSINTVADGGLGSIIWYDQNASSLSELTSELVQMLDKDMLDEQIATALLTGIVAETDRFSNEKTSSQTMSVSAVLMAAGANQQLVANKLDEPLRPVHHDEDADDSQDKGDYEGNEQGNDNSETPDDGPDPLPPKPNDGTIEINHESEEQPVFELPSPQADETPAEEPKPEEPAPEAEAGDQPSEGLLRGSKLMVDAPTLGGTLTANSTPEALDPSTDPLSLPAERGEMFLNRSDDATVQPATDPAPSMPEAPAMPNLPPLPPEPAAPLAMTPPPADWTPPQPAAPSLTDLEAAIVPSEPSEPEVPIAVDDARDEVFKALNSSTDAPAPQPIAALNAQPLGDSLHQAPPEQDNSQIGPMLEDILDPQPSNDPNAPPPVPPPIPFNFGNPGNSPQ